MGGDHDRPRLHSKNVDAEPATAVTWTRLDDDAATTPNRFVSSIYVDPTNGNHAWISYSGFDSNTPAHSGSRVRGDVQPGTGTSTWVDRSYDLGDLPVTDLVRDDATGDLYAATTSASCASQRARRAGRWRRRGCRTSRSPA